MGQIPNTCNFYLVHCLDGPDKYSLREQLTNTHREYMENYRQKILIGGPLLDESGLKRIGSAFIMQADSKEEIEVLLKKEPYYNAGVFESVVIRLYRNAMFKPSLLDE